jgi:drug/metabolite transporter (DMT)-like permease
MSRQLFIRSSTVRQSFWSAPSARDLLAFAALGTVCAIGHLLSIVAFRFAEASTLSPLVYVELIGAAGFGCLMFDEIPGWPTVIGAACIVAAGVVLLREANR